jgi:Glycosyltransferases involved in cell wall biogenesis
MNNKLPLISVIIPTFNRASIIERAIHSVLKQTHKNIEIIIVDDCSTDGTQSILNKFKNNNFFYFLHEKNKGPAAARNTGIFNSSGEYIAFLDSDNEWLPKKLEIQIRSFQKAKDIGLVYCDTIVLKNHQIVSIIPSPAIKNIEGNIFNSLLIENFIDTSSVLIKKECFQNIGYFDEKFDCLEDYDLFLRICKCYNVKHVKDFLVKYHFSENGVNGKPIEMHVEKMGWMYEKHKDYYSHNKKVLAGKFFAIGNLYCLDNSYLKGQSYFLKSLHVQPCDIVTAFFLIICFLTRFTHFDFYKFAFRMKNSKVRKLVRSMSRNKLYAF